MKYTAVYGYTADGSISEEARERIQAAFPDMQVRSDGFFATVDGTEFSSTQEAALEGFVRSTGGYWSATEAEK